MLKVLLTIVHGLEISISNYGVGGLSSAFHLLEISHTHFWTKVSSGKTNVYLLSQVFRILWRTWSMALHLHHYLPVISHLLAAKIIWINIPANILLYHHNNIKQIIIFVTEHHHRWTTLRAVENPRDPKTIRWTLPLVRY